MCSLYRSYRALYVQTFRWSTSTFYSTAYQCTTASRLNTSSPFRCCFHSSSKLYYKEDFEKLGVQENASLEEIKSAYFKKAKEYHPDSSNGEQENDNENFIEITEAYRRLTYEAKFGTSSFDKSDPRNDPRAKEYWDIRRRKRNPKDVKVEEEMLRQRKEREKKMLIKALLGLTLGVFFGTIFPALFIGDDDYKECCSCDKCLLQRIRNNPSTRSMLRQQTLNAASSSSS